jgi:hypothetical protein
LTFLIQCCYRQPEYKRDFDGQGAIYLAKQSEFVKSRGSCEIGQLKQEKLSLSSLIDDLEEISEVRPLTTHEIDLNSQYNAKLADLLREEELKCY